MTHKDFFSLLIKMFGLYSLTILVFNFLPTTIPQLIAFGSWYAIISIPAILAIPVGLMLLLIYKPGVFIRALKLDQGFEGEKIIFGDLTSENLLKLACIVIGGFLIIESIPGLVSQGIFLFKESLANKKGDSKDHYVIIALALKCLLGYIMVKNFSLISRLLNVRK